MSYCVICATIARNPLPQDKQDFGGGRLFILAATKMSCRISGQTNWGHYFVYYFIYFLGVQTYPALWGNIEHQTLFFCLQRVKAAK